MPYTFDPFIVKRFIAETSLFDKNKQISLETRAKMIKSRKIYSIFSTTTLDLFLLKRFPPPRFTQ